MASVAPILLVVNLSNCVLIVLIAFTRLCRFSLTVEQFLFITLASGLWESMQIVGISARLVPRAYLRQQEDK